MDLDQWHRRYQQQARWTASIRDYLINQTALQPNACILEVGVGTGAVLGALSREKNIKPFGIDINHPTIEYAKGVNQAFRLAQADGNWLPFSNNVFDLTYCHYLLLWVADPFRILSEMHRVTRSKGFLIALAEPDHSSRIDYPPPLDELGKLQTSALENQGADPAMGRKLRALLEESGVCEVEAGILGAQWTKTDSHPEKTEWMAIETDLGNQLSQDQLAHYRTADQKAYQNGKRVLFIPTFYAIGRVP